MRLWHKDLIHFLPRQQLVAQYRELCSIAKDWGEKGTTNHILINKVMDYSASHLFAYGRLVIDEMKNRKYNIRKEPMERFCNYCVTIGERENENTLSDVPYVKLFEGWHTDRYLKQCLYNLQEKYDCGGISQEDWDKIEEHFNWIL
jgi:uncharacterized protein (TIGR02328 family)